MVFYHSTSGHFVWKTPKSPVFLQGTVLKCYVKSTNFSSNASNNVESFYMSFGGKILIALGLKAVKFETTKKSILVWKFALSTLMAYNSWTTGNFATKTHGEAFHISAGNWHKSGGFNITFLSRFLPLHLGAKSQF